MADRIRDLKTGKDLEHFAEDVLPQFEKFLESPEERRLRRVRAGVVTACIGLGWSLVFLFMTLAKSDFLPFLGPGLITFFVGLGIIINGLAFTALRKKLPGNEQDALAQNLLDSSMKHETPPLRVMTNELAPAVRNPAGSITEHTTHHLGSKNS